MITLTGDVRFHFLGFGNLKISIGKVSKKYIQGKGTDIHQGHNLL
jgi:hypothetical protein